MTVDTAKQAYKRLMDEQPDLFKNLYAAFESGENPLFAVERIATQMFLAGAEALANEL